MKCIAGVFLLAATGMAQALLAPVESHDCKINCGCGSPGIPAHDCFRTLEAV